jgi:hypothetical protein
MLHRVAAPTTSPRASAEPQNETAQKQLRSEMRSVRARRGGKSFQAPRPPFHHTSSVVCAAQRKVWDSMRSRPHGSADCSDLVLNKEWVVLAWSGGVVVGVRTFLVVGGWCLRWYGPRCVWFALVRHLVAFHRRLVRALFVVFLFAPLFLLRDFLASVASVCSAW